MTNTFNYRYKTHNEALTALQNLTNKISNKLKHNITLQKSGYGYWNLKLSIENENTNKTKNRVFNILT